MTDHVLPVAAAAVDPSFLPDGDGRGTFEAAGRRITVVLEPDGWLVAAAPVDASPDSLLARQALILGPAKVALAPGPAVLAEMPAMPSLEDALRRVLDAVRAGVAVLNGVGAPGFPAGDPDEAAVALAAYASSCPWDQDQSGARWSFRIATPGGLQRIVAEAIPGFARLTSTLAPLVNASVEARAALGHFLAALNGSLRLARGALTDSAAVLEVILPVAGLGPSVIEKAVGALIVGSAAARRECMALLDVPRLAGAYCSFHLERRTAWGRSILW
jgi:hypothetical protein